MWPGAGWSECGSHLSSYPGCPTFHFTGVETEAQEGNDLTQTMLLVTMKPGFITQASRFPVSAHCIQVHHLIESVFWTYIYMEIDTQTHRSPQKYTHHQTVLKHTRRNSNTHKLMASFKSIRPVRVAIMSPYVNVYWNLQCFPIAAV